MNTQSFDEAVAEVVYHTPDCMQRSNTMVANGLKPACNCDLQEKLTHIRIAALALAESIAQERERAALAVIRERAVQSLGSCISPRSLIEHIDDRLATLQAQKEAKDED
jgi:hypothetical protein